MASLPASLRPLVRELGGRVGGWVGGEGICPQRGAFGRIQRRGVGQIPDKVISIERSPDGHVTH